MPSFLPGNKMRAWANSYRISKITDSFEVERMADTIDVTNHETQGSRAFIASLRSGGAKWGGIFDASTEQADELIARQLGSTTPTVWTIAFEGDGVGKIAHLYSGREKMMSISAPVAGRVGVQGETDAIDTVLTGSMLRQGTAPTASTGASAAVNNGAATAFGGVAHFHVTDTPAALGSITAKVQHSSAGVSWADIATFTSTAIGSLSFTTTALAVKAQTRAIVTALTGSTAVYLAVGFARKTA